MRFKFVYDFGEQNEYSIKVRCILKRIPKGVVLPVCVETGCSNGTPDSVAEVSALLAGYSPRRYQSSDSVQARLEKLAT